MEKNINIYETNIELLRKNHPETWKKIIKYKNTIPVEIIKSANNELNLKVKTNQGSRIYLHNEDNPKSEEQHFLNFIDKESKGVVIFHGMGLGYGPISILKKRQDIRFLFIFEPIPDFFIKAVENIDLRLLLTDKRVILSIDKNPDVKQVLKPASRAMRLEEINLLKHEPSFTCNKKLYENLYEQTYISASEHNISGSTHKVFGKNFVRNRLSFLNLLNHTSLIDSLAGKFKNIPAILVASGPSLKKNIHLLKKFKNKAVILAVDSVLPALIKNGIEPDFVTAIDYRDVTYEKIASCAPHVKNISLICSSWVCKDVPKVFPAENIFWSYTGIHMEKWINTALGGKISTPAVGTVAHLNLISALIMECSPIVFVGQDLSFSPEDAEDDHIEGAVIRNNSEFKKLLQNNESVWVKSNYGDKIPTMRAFYGFIKHFELLIQKNPNNYINATQGGAFIEGTEIKNLQNVYDEFCQKKFDINQKIGVINKTSRLSGLSRLLDEINAALFLIKKNETLIYTIKEIIASAETAILKLTLSKIKYTSSKTLPEELKNNLIKIDQLSDKIDSENILWKFFNEATVQEMTVNERMKYKIDKLKDDETKYLEWLLKNLERLNKVYSIKEKLLSDFKTSLKNFLNYHDKEKELSEGIKKDDLLVMDLIRLYMESGDLMLAKPYLEKIAAKENNLEACFYLGQIAALHTDYETSELYFKKIKNSSNNKFKQKINDFKFELASRFYQHGLFSMSHSIDTQRLMLFKGVNLYPDHEKLIELASMTMEADLNGFEESLNQNNEDEAKKIIQSWENIFEKNETFKKNINNTILENFYLSAGKIYRASKDELEAITCLNKSIAINDNAVEARIILSDILFSMNQDDIALQYLNKAIETDPKFVDSYKKKIKGQEVQKLLQEANMLYSSGKFEEAKKIFYHILELDPKNVEAMHNLGVTYNASGDDYHAITLYYKTLELNPGYFSADYNLGVIFLEKGEYKEAIKFFQKTIDIDHNNENAFINIGNAFKAMNRIDKAENYYKQALKINPASLLPLNNLGVISQEKGNIEEAVSYYEKFLKKEPDNPSVLENYLDQLQYACKWEKASQALNLIFPNIQANIDENKKPGIRPFQSLRLVDDPEFHLKIANAYLPPLPEKQFQHIKKQGNKKIHIGYLSSDFKDHPIGHILSNYIDMHDKDTFHITCYSRTTEKDSFYKKIKKASNEIYDIRNLGYKNAAEKIFNDGIDILVDLTGHTNSSNFPILMYKPAPIQVSYLGFLGTSGAEYMDYIISDKVVTPENVQRYYSEKLAFLPDCYQVLDYSHLPQGQTYSRKDFGLPEKSIVFCSFNQPYKYEQKIFETWIKILKRVDNSVLWLRKTSEIASKNILSFAENKGIPKDRIIFSNKVFLQDHLKRLELADIALDPIVYNGGATTNNALFAGIPVVTKLGNSFTSRMSSSSLNALGLPELITNSLEEYEELAVKIAKDQLLLNQIKDKIKFNKKNSNLFNTEIFTKNLENLYKNMLKKYYS